MVLEEEEGLEEGEDEMCRGQDHGNQTIALPVLLHLEHLRDTESIQDHRTAAERCNKGITVTS